MKKITMLAIVLISGCSTQASRMADCEAQGVSRDACYISEQNRQSTIHAAAEKQALENAQTQFAQAVKEKAHTWKGYDVEVKRDSLGIVTLDGKPAVQSEVTDKATAYEQGLFTIIFYKTGKVALMKEGQFVGYLK